MKKIHVFFLVIALVVVVISYFFYNAYFLDLNKQESSVPLQISIGSLVDARLYELNESELTDVSFIPEGSIISRSRRNNVNARASIVMPKNEIGSVLLFENSEGSKQLDDGASIKDVVVVSPNGLYIAYAELNLDFGTTLYSESVLDWNIMLMEIATGNVTDVGVGFGPQFIDGDSIVLVYSTPNGIAGYDVVSEESFLVLPELGVKDTATTARISPNSLYFVAFSQTTGRYNLFTIVESFPLELSGFGEAQVAFEKIAITDEYVYGTIRDQQTNKQTLWQYRIEDLSLPFAEGELLYTFLEGEIPYQIIP